MEKIEYIISNLKKLFLADSRTWVITFSGGKDSTFMLHIFILMLLELKKEGIKYRKVYILSYDTKVEMPILEAYHKQKMQQINDFVKRENLNVSMSLVEPTIEDDFFVCLLGKGYPSPNSGFRWCTERIKINPATAYLNSVIEKHNSIVMLLGVRTDESTARKNSIEKREFNEKDYVIHEQLANTYTFSPIKDITTEELWKFLSTEEAPWGTHKDMMALYDIGSAEADCNIIVHPNSESCAKTRFGCWVCTVVEKDSSMENAIKNNQSWMQPMANFRNKIFTYRYDHTKRRDKNKNGKNIPGAFFLEVRKELFEDILKTEEQIGNKLFEVLGRKTLLSDEQILEINKEHQKDGDFCNDVLKIANRYGRSFKINEIKLDDDIALLCEENDLDKCYFSEMLRVGHKYRHAMKRLGIKTEQDKLITATVQGIVHEDK